MSPAPRAPSKPAGVENEGRSERSLRWALGVCGVVAAVIGAYLLLDPAGFYASYGVDVTGQGPALLSDMRGNGATFLVLGGVFAAGARGTVQASTAAALAAAFYLGFAASRGLGFFLDGAPPDDILQAGAVELLLGGVTAGLLVVVRRGQSSATLETRCSAAGLETDHVRDA